MRFEVTKRDAVILSIFMVVLVICCYAYVRWATSPKAKVSTVEADVRSSEMKYDGESSHGSTEETLKLYVEEMLKRRTTAVQKYELIWKRNIFRETIGEGVATSANVVRRSNITLPVLPPASVVVKQEEPSSKPAQSYQEKPKNITYTAFVLIGGKPLALLEDTSIKDGCYVGEGEYAFGVRVLRITPDVIEVEKDGQIFYYALGENKEERELLARGGSPQPQQRSTTSQQEQPARSSETSAGGTSQPEQQKVAQPTVTPPQPPSFEGRKGFIERIMQRLRERYGENIPPEVEERLKRFRRRLEEDRSD
ncbi:MAG: hypothetical protein RUDDFDWM_000361 [Candidatus Fervidibacterota bacterium]